VIYSGEETCPHDPGPQYLNFLPDLRHLLLPSFDYFASHLTMLVQVQSKMNGSETTTSKALGCHGISTFLLEDVSIRSRIDETRFAVRWGIR
jgi:hypothetical protein